jgi:hypothetical protein
MTMGWFLPVGVMIGAAGTQTAWKSRHATKAHTREWTWSMLVVLAWLPIFCWIVAQFVDQY